MKAYVIERAGKLGRGRLTDIAPDDLDPGDVTLATAYAGVNFKDALAGMGAAQIVRRFPCIGGIEGTGVILDSDDPGLATGTAAIVHGHGIGVSHHGGFAERIRVPAAWVRPLPERLDLLEAATLGVAGYSAALAVDRLEALGVRPGPLPVAVSGATGGVGRFAVAMLAGRGFTVTALTSRTASGDELKALGAADVCTPEDLGGKPLEQGRFVGGVDAVGGQVLPRMLAATAPGGVVASIGNAGGVALETTVLPFILRGITLTGINADSDQATRARIWQRLAGDLKPPQLARMATRIPLEDLPRTLAAMLEGQAPGRSVVDFGRATDGTAARP